MQAISVLAYSMLRWVRRFPMNCNSPFCSILRVLRLQTQIFQVLNQTLFPCILGSNNWSRTIHQKPSTTRNPIIHILAFHMPKPPQSSPSDHIRHSLNLQASTQLLNFYSTIQLHTTHPSHHPVLCSHQPIHVLILHVSLPYTKTDCTHALYNFPFMLKDTSLVV